MLGRRDIDVNYDWTPHVGRYCNDDILRGDYWKQRKAESPSDLRPRHAGVGHLSGVPDRRVSPAIRYQALPCIPCSTSRSTRTSSRSHPSTGPSSRRS